jgi:hypothetical protein
MSPAKLGISPLGFASVSESSYNVRGRGEARVGGNHGEDNGEECSRMKNRVKSPLR